MTGQVQTERGLLTIAETFKTAEQAIRAGYSRAFRSTKLDKELFSKCLDDRGLYHKFAVVEDK